MATYEQFRQLAEAVIDHQIQEDCVALGHIALDLIDRLEAAEADNKQLTNKLIDGLEKRVADLESRALEN